MIATPPVAVSVNGRLVGYVGSRYRGNPHVRGASLEIERIKRLPPSQQRKAAQALRRGNPLTRAEIRQVAALCSKEHGKHLRRNPRGGCRPGETEIYSDVERIFAKKGRRSNAAGEKFVHQFRHAVACGCKDGTVMLRGRGGRRLWNLFQA